MPWCSELSWMPTLQWNQWSRCCHLESYRLVIELTQKHSEQISAECQKCQFYCLSTSSGSTDVVSCSVHGVRDPVTAALHIVLGESPPSFFYCFHDESLNFPVIKCSKLWQKTLYSYLECKSIFLNCFRPKGFPTCLILPDSGLVTFHYLFSFNWPQAGSQSEACLCGKLNRDWSVVARAEGWGWGVGGGGEVWGVWEQTGWMDSWGRAQTDVPPQDRFQLKSQIRSAHLKAPIQFPSSSSYPPTSPHILPGGPVIHQSAASGTGCRAWMIGCCSEMVFH